MKTSADCDGAEEREERREDEESSAYAVRWRASSYVSAVTGSLVTLREESQLVDVTLSCGGRRLDAHRLLLAACSPYFRRVFADNPCPHPVIVFGDVPYEDLASVVDFMYRGEVSVPHARLASFLKTAELLQVRGLTAPENSASSVPSVPSAPSVPDETEQTDPVDILPKRRKIQIEEPTTDDINAADASTLSTNAANSSTPPELLPIDAITREAIQDEDLVKFRCQLCWKGFKHPTSLTLHKDSHTGKTQCPVCRRSFSRSYDMKSHLLKIHQDQTPPDPKPKASKSSIVGDT